MKKWVLLFLIIVFICGCSRIDYTFMDITWTRNLDSDTESIIFSNDGTFNYYCACGNPVDDSDLCETYSYDKDKKEIKLNCEETNKIIRIVNVTSENFEIDFDGEIRIFNKN